MVEYLDPSIANEGQSANNWTPGAWTITPNLSDEEWQPDIDPPRINDYAAFKKHKHYGKYFRPYRRVAFPAFVYHQANGEKLVNTREEVLALGPAWTPFIPIWDHATLGRKVIKSEQERDDLGLGWTPAMFDPSDSKWHKRIVMSGKSHPVKSETQRLAEVVAQALAVKEGSGGIDATAIAAVVAAVMAATQTHKPAEVASLKIAPIEAEIKADDVITVDDRLGDGATVVHVEGDVERAALIELAEKDGVKIDKRWGNDRIKKELGL